VLLLAALLLASATGGWSQTYERSKSVSRSFPANKGTEIQVLNKYGNITMIPWEKDSVRFEIMLTVKATKQSKADNTFDFIDFDFKATQYYVIAQTVFQGESDFWAELSDMTKSMFSSGQSTQIDYTVYFPADAGVRVENKFGNIYTTDHLAKASFTLSNGDLRAHSFSDDAQIHLEFGSATIEEMKRGKLNINYGDVTIGNGEFLEIESKSSEIAITSVNDLRINSKRDKLRLTTLGSLSGESSYTTLNIAEITGQMELKLFYGILDVNRITNSSDYITLNSQYAEITLKPDLQVTCSVSLTYNERTQITYPDTPVEKTESVVNAEEKIKKVEFLLGPKQGKSIPVTIRTNAGKITFKNK